MGNKGTGYDKYVNGCRCCGDDSYSRQFRDGFAIGEGLKEYYDDPLPPPSFKAQKLPKKKSTPKDKCTDNKRHTFEWVDKIQGWGSYDYKFRRYQYEGPYTAQICSGCGKQGKVKKTQAYRQAYLDYEWSMRLTDGYGYYSYRLWRQRRTYGV